jgi:asparagine synthase (glutamine-hydrolysing)
MCGLTGFYDLTPSQPREALRAACHAMQKALTHRGPDDFGLWDDENVPLFLAHRRLAIIDLSPAGRQPMISASGRYVVSFNGEIYNFPALAEELKRHGARFRGHSDTEVMLAAFDMWGVEAALQKLNGMFAFALWDRAERELHLVRDRLGKKPLYLGWAGGALLFASELKAFHAHPAFAPEVNRDALTLYMRYAYVPAPFSIYRNVWQLPPGSRAVIGAATAPGSDLAASFAPYWHQPRVVEAARGGRLKDEAEALQKLETLLDDCVRERMISDVPLGAFLSGGIDSSLIAALMQKYAQRPVRTFSIGFRETGFDEAGNARAVAKHLGTEHQEMYVGADDALSVIPRLPEIYDEPFADSSQIPTFLLSAFTRGQVTVALSGDGGDEMFGGYLRHYVAPELWRRIGWMPQGVRRRVGGAMLKVSAERWQRLVPQQPQIGERLHKVAELIQLGSPQQMYRHLVGQWQEPERVVIGGREPVVPLVDPGWQPQGLSFAERMMYGDALAYLSGDVLAKVDRASMAVALEVRAPLLDPRVFEFAWGLPQEMKIRGGSGKWILRRLLARHMPENLFERPKQGFAVPVGEWLRGPLREWAEELLDEKRLEAEGYLDAAEIRAAWAAHLSGKGRQAHKLWTALMFQSWRERWRA